MTDDLIAWLRAQLDDDERVARAAAAGGRWSYSKGDSVGAWTLYDEHWSIASMTVYDTEAYNYSERMPAVRHPGYIDPDAIGGHMALHDPTRVLAEVDAKRRILDQVVDEATGLDMQVDGEFRVGSRDDVAEPYLGDVLTRLLALPYADRPGYREEWRP